jgi:hypothetical protein
MEKNYFGFLTRLFERKNNDEPRMPRVLESSALNMGEFDMLAEHGVGAFSGNLPEGFVKRAYLSQEKLHETQHASEPYRV